MKQCYRCLKRVLRENGFDTYNVYGPVFVCWLCYLKGLKKEKK